MRKSCWFACAVGIPTLSCVVGLLEAASADEEVDLRQRVQQVGEWIRDGRYAQAESLATALFDEAKLGYDSHSVEMAEAMEALARARIRVGRSHEEETLDLARQSLAIKRLLYDSESLEVAASLNLVGRVYLNSSRYEEAKDYFRQVRKIRETFLGAEDAEVATAIYNLALCHWSLGEYLDAKDLFEQSLAIRLKALGVEHRLVARSQLMVASTQLDLGQYSEARAGFERARATYEATLGPDHPELGYCLNNYGMLLRAMGDYPGARDIWAEALELRERTLGPEHWLVGQTLNNLATAQIDLGEYDQAETNLVRAVQVGKKSPEPSELAFALTNLGEVLRFTSRSTEALEHYERALRITEEVYGPNHWRVAESLVNFARVLSTMDLQEKARERCERAYCIYVESLGKEHPWTGTCLGTLGEAKLALGEEEAAAQNLQEAASIYEAAYGSSHPTFAYYTKLLADLYWQAGDMARAMAYAHRAEETSREHLRLVVRVLPERQALSYAETRLSGLSLLLSIAEDASVEDLRKTWSAVIRSRSLVLDEMAARNRAMGTSQNPEYSLLWERVVTARTHLANLSVRGPGTEPVEMHAVLLEQARQEKEEAERALAKASVSFQEELEEQSIGLSEVASALPPRSALLAFVVHDKLAPGRGGGPSIPRETGTSGLEEAPRRSYLAFVLRREVPEPQVVRLAPAARIDALVSQWRDEIEVGMELEMVPGPVEARYRSVGTALRQQIWDPVVPSLGDAERVFIVPDGVLHLVSFAALPVGEEAYLVEEGPLLHHLSAERDLLLRGDGRVSGINDGLLVVGGPDFDDTSSYTALSTDGIPAETSDPPCLRHRPSLSDCDAFEIERFSPLPSTTIEAQEIAALWIAVAEGGSMRPGQVLCLTGSEACEAAVKKHVSGRRVLHFATHGFFLGSECQPRVTSARGMGGLKAKVEPTSPRVSTMRNPLLSSGLVLAGANHRRQAGPRDEDGILTAEEISALDLSGVEWVVLSACDTGVGEVLVGEGVFGMRRAFEVAGAATLIMSLWSVEDEATRAWMQTLYEARMAGMDTAASVRTVSQRVLTSRRAEGLDTHPSHWAAFVGAGDWH